MMFNMSPALTPSFEKVNAQITIKAKIALIDVINAVIGHLKISV